MHEFPLRLSAIEREILELLTVHGEMYGLALVDASSKLKRGTIYVTLGRMADKGLVDSRTVKVEHERGLPRRLFRLTGLGARVLQAVQLATSVLAEGLA
jgi:DNA-binding PadR family transcriptional regulator